MRGLPVNITLLRWVILRHRGDQRPGVRVGVRVRVTVTVRVRVRVRVRA